MSLFINKYSVGNDQSIYIAEFSNEKEAKEDAYGRADEEFSSSYDSYLSTEECEDCQGKGFLDDDPDEYCLNCDGSGSVEYDDYDDMFSSSLSLEVTPYDPEIHTLQWMHDNNVEDRTPNQIFRYALEEQGYF